MNMNSVVWNYFKINHVNMPAKLFEQQTGLFLIHLAFHSTLLYWSFLMTQMSTALLANIFTSHSCS